jgi:hypothetical protein
MGEFFNLDICASSGTDDSGFPKIGVGAAVLSSTFSLLGSIALVGLVTGGMFEFT